MCTSGMIMMWGGDKDAIPAGWLECNGSFVDQSSYPDLFQAIGYNFGQTTSATQLYLPDLRGRFVRGVDDGAGRDPDEATRTDMQNPELTSSSVGSVQSHAFQNHIHTYSEWGSDADGLDKGGDYSTYVANTSEADSTTYNVSTETRPINAYLYYIIKI
jgi:microcystin-dependent protein